MALLSPSQIHKVLKEERLETAQTESKKSITKLLEDAGLTPSEVLEKLSDEMRSGETGSVRLRAAETALKLNGLLDDSDRKADFNVTIVIQDSEFSLNPILIPRQ